jgi:hypothetical protein
VLLLLLLLLRLLLLLARLRLPPLLVRADGEVERSEGRGCGESDGREQG